MYHSINGIVIDNGKTTYISPKNDWLWAGHLFSRSKNDSQIYKFIQSYLLYLFNNHNIQTLCVICRSDGDIHDNPELDNRYTNSECIIKCKKQAEEENKILIIGTLGQITESNLNYLYLPIDDDFFVNGVVSYFKNDWCDWSNKSSKLVWRGGLIGDLRYRLVEKMNNVENTDIKHTDATQKDVENYFNSYKKYKVFGCQDKIYNLQESYRGSWIHYTEFMKYKIFIITDAEVISSTHMWGFASGCVPFYISRCKCWFTPYLEPFVNHIPISYDLSDLEEKIEWVRNNDEQAEQISKNALKLAETVFSSDFQKNYLTKSINTICGL